MPTTTATRRPLAAAGLALVLREPRPSYPVPDEAALSTLWRRAHTLSEGLVTRDGRRWHVVYPGRPADGAGPDFRDAVFADQDGELVFGDVEIHLDQRDWRTHGHHLDPSYDGVVLHVVLNPGAETVTPLRSKATVPITDLGGVLGSLDAAGDAVPSVLEWVRDLTARELGDLLDTSGDRRFVGKSRGFAMELQEEAADQVLYRALMECLGYSANRRPFRDLAGRVRWSTLARLRTEPDSTRLPAIRTALFRGAGLSGLLLDSVAQPAMAASERAGRGRQGVWRPSAGRPANDPVRRLSGAAVLVDRYLQTGLVEGLRTELWHWGGRSIVQGVTVRPYVGAARARDAAVNVVLPVLHALAGVKRDRATSIRCLEEFRGFPRLQDNSITREMRRLLDLEKRGVEAAGARRQQGLIYLYKNVLGSRVFLG